ncbi:glycoside hydrolase family 95 protein [Symbioplanes lichenis]|uniref:glycoside hydrolase family 95 protein n=1 Tax=Symbioplanes lichenis TaxID=1629072 RepID=UPI00273899D4|nr:glycoside hydrolase N-terminal domain-containing protein [Actinoplanes lichenis]
MDRRTVLAGSGAAVVAGQLALGAAAAAAEPGYDANLRNDPGPGNDPSLRNGLDPRNDLGPRNDLTLWYDEPGTDWESQALPIGNGILGASILGDPAADAIVLNEKTLWTGGPGSPGYDFGNWRTPRPGAVAQVQRAIDERERVPPEEVAAVLGQSRVGYGSYQSLGTLTLATTPGPVESYRRELDLSTAVARTRYVANGIRYTREYFVSHPDQVLVVRLAADRPGAVDVAVSLTVPEGRTAATTVSRGRLTVSGALDDNGLRHETQIQVVTRGGTRTDEAAGVTVSGADSVLVIVAAGTDYSDRYPTYRGPDPHPRITRTLQAALHRQDQLRDAHIRDHRALFDRVRLDLGRRPADRPTDELLAAYQGDDPALETLFFQYGRYLLIASSRAGTPLPANLQGVWNPYAAAPWSADYHVNINLQMNYWPAYATNLSETTTPLHDFVHALRAPGAVTAREMFGASGWVVHNETNPFGFTGVHDWPTAFWFPEAAAWIARHLYEHYLYTLDQTFLRERAYPVLRDVARFWLDELHTDPRDGRLVVSPSYSPEHGDFSAGASMSQQIVLDLFTSVSHAAGVVGDGRFKKEVQAALQRLDPGTRIGSWGQLQEWKGDWDDPADDHRHVSHLFALHPGRQITPSGTPALAAAAEVSLRARGDGGTGWSKAWKINFWARLHDGDHAHLMLSEQLRTSTLSNLWDTHPPFQIDGNFGATAGVAEMLLQSHAGELHILPALPTAWPEGRVTGLRARGDLTVDITWADGAATELTVRAGHGGPVTVRSSLVPGGLHTFTARAGGTYSWKGSS